MTVEEVRESGGGFYPAAVTNVEYFVDLTKTVASHLMIPFWKAEAPFQYCLLPFHPGEYGQEVNKTAEYTKRFFIAAVALPTMVVTLPLLLLSFPLTGLARVYESDNYRHLSGMCPQRELSRPKFFHLNACMFFGGLPYVMGGVTPADSRFKELMATVKEVNPDILFLCEFNRTLSRPIHQNLKGIYSDFFVDIGLNAQGMENALMVASRVPIVSKPRYIPFSMKIEGEQKYLKRGFFAVETKGKWYIYTHLHPKDGAYDRDVRQRQLIEIQDFIDIRTGDKPVILLGDLNINRLDDSSHEYEAMIERGDFVDYFADQHPDLATASDALDLRIKGSRKEAPPEVIDYALINPKGKEVPLEIELYDTSRARPDLALSDHRGLIGIG